MLMKVLTPAFFARKDTKTPMYIALVSLVLNASLNYILAFVFNYGHVGIAVGSSIAAFVSIIILETILVKKNIVKLENPFNRFNFSILASSTLLIIFLYSTSLFINFIDLSELERVFYLLVKIFFAITIYVGVARLINLKPLKEIF